MQNPQPGSSATSPDATQASAAAPGAAREPLSRPARTFGERLLAALKLDASVYEEVEHDPGALGQAAGVVGLAAVAGAIGAAGTVGAAGTIAGVVNAFVTWVVWTALVWLVGVKVFEHSSDFQQLLRALGFVAAPQLLYLIAILPIPGLAVVLVLAVLVMTAIAFVRAVRQALDVDNNRALLVAGLAVVTHIVLGAVFAALASLF